MSEIVAGALFMFVFKETSRNAYTQHCPHCLSKTSKNGVVTWFHYVLEAKLVTSFKTNGNCPVERFNCIYENSAAVVRPVASFFIRVNMPKYGLKTVAGKPQPRI